MKCKGKWVAAAIMVSFCTSMVGQLLNFILGLQFAALDFQMSATGFHLSYFALGALLARVLIVQRIKESNVKKFAEMGLALMTVSCMGYMLFINGNTLIICRILQGFAFGIASSAVPTITMQYMKSSLHSIGLIGIISVTASLVGPPLALQLFQKNGFQFVCIIAVIAAFIAFMLCYWLPKGNIRVEKQQKEERGISRKMFVHLFFLCILLVLCNCYMVLLTPYAKENGKLLDSSYFLIAGSVSAIFVRFFLSRIMKTKKTLAICFLGSALIYTICIVCMIQRPFSISFLLSGIAVGIFSGIMMSWLHLAIIQEEKDNKAHANTVFYFAQDIANIVCGIFWSAISGFADYQQSFVFSGLLLCLTAVCFVWINNILGKTITKV